MKWIDFFLCLFLGIFGIHKFREKKIGAGLLYLFTCGLFGIGWLYDCIRYFVAAIKMQNASVLEPVSGSTMCDTPELPSDEGKASSRLGNLLKNWRWVLVVVLALFVFSGFPSISALMALVAIALIIPIPKWQKMIEKHIAGKSKNITAIGMAALAFFLFPAARESGENSEQTTPVAVVIETAEPEHIHIFLEATCLTPQTCTDCGETKGDALGHTWEAASCMQPKTCTLCKKTEGGLADHTWEAATCLVLKTCSVCHLTDGEFAEHSWEDATCLAPKTCSVCKETEGDLADHSWIEATCLAPKTCSVCNTTKGDVTKHSWEDATCLVPKTCTVCKATKGDLGKHVWEKATCMAPKTCSVCGEKDGKAVECKYKNGICVYCEAYEPTVWIPRSGSRYHTHAGCSNMDNPSEVPISKAISRGFTPCKRCY